MIHPSSSPIRRSAGAWISIAAMMFAGGCSQQKAPQRPQSVIGEPTISQAQPTAAGEVVDAAVVIKKIQRDRADAMERKSREQFSQMAARPGNPPAESQSLQLMKTLRIDARSEQAMTASIEAIKSRLSESDAEGFNAAVRVLMVTSLPPSLLAGKKNVTDQEIWSHILPVLHNRTPVEVLIEAKARMQQLPVGDAEAEAQ